MGQSPEHADSLLGVPVVVLGTQLPKEGADALVESYLRNFVPPNCTKRECCIKIDFRPVTGAGWGSDQGKYKAIPALDLMHTY